MNKLLPILKSSFTVTIFSLAGVGASFLLQIFLATNFGTTYEADSYLAASTIPTLFNTVFLTSLSITFIPVFVEYSLRSNKNEAWTIANMFIIFVIIIFGDYLCVGDN